MLLHSYINVAGLSVNLTATVTLGICIIFMFCIIWVSPGVHVVVGHVLRCFFFVPGGAQQRHKDCARDVHKDLVSMARELSVSHLNGQ